MLLSIMQKGGTGGGSLWITPPQRRRCTFKEDSRCTAQWLDIHITYEVITPINPAPTWPWAVCGYYNITGYIRCAAVYFYFCDSSTTTSLYLLIPSPFSPSPHPQPLSYLATIKMFSVSMSLFPFCLFIYFVFQIPHVSEIIWHLSFCVGDLFH